RDLQRALEGLGRRFAPDPACEECTIGGMLATNASGARAVRHGTTRDHVEALRVVLDSGDARAVTRASRWPSAFAPHGPPADLVSATVTLLEQNSHLLRACRPNVPFDRCGYALHDALDAQHLDLARLFVGSEGTLGLFTEATLRTIPLPAGRS